MFRKISKTHVAAIVFWLALWQIASMKIGQEILLVSPFSAIRRLLELSTEGVFWLSIYNSFVRVATGFLAGFIAGILFAAISANSRYFRILIEPLMQVIQTVPVVSFIILCLIWINSKHLSIIISFMMCLPIVYRNMLSGINGVSKNLKDMAAVFKIGKAKRLRYIYLSELSPYIRSACSISIGLCWKAGMAAEVIGMPVNSIGENLYQAKIYLNTADLFAWTIVIVILSVILKKSFLWIINSLINRLEIK